jgi:poly[(R)-3-hydroxyalkanoate] polymerase subunit PhaC
MDYTAAIDDKAAERLAAFNRRLLAGAMKPLEVEGWLDGAEFVRALATGFAHDGERVMEIQRRYYGEQLELWKKYASFDHSPGAIEEPPKDRRFAGPEWRSHPYYAFLVQSYLLSARCLIEIVHGARLEAPLKRKLEFFTRQLIDAMSPANFPWSNPEALKLASDTRGESLARGMQHLAADAAKGMISMTDESAFEIGRNLAVTPGAVIFENELMQLIQYRPSTAKVFERPLLMVPPCINKYYILDLQPENSFVRYAVDQGHTVFMVSWRNVPPELGRITWDDYLERGVAKAIEVAAEICSMEKINTLGFCVGGTLLGSAAAVMSTNGLERIENMTLLAAMLDFSDTGELSVFVDESYVRSREREFATGGVLPGRDLALTFASLRANDLIWHYVINNYLKGRQPDSFDLLFWNADSTNLSGAMYAYYVRNMYLENNLKVPGKLIMCGVPVDLGTLDMPAFIVATREDHIVPWRTAYASTQLLTGRIEFVLAASGHIAGIINPASRNRRNYWLNDRLQADPDRWLEGATSHSGTWWSHWSNWLKPFGGVEVAARQTLGRGRYAEIEPAPGRYVKEKAQSL